MKKIRCVLLLFVTGIMFVLGGCSAMPVHYGQIENYPASNDYELVDDPVSDEEMCTLIIDKTLTLVRMGEPGQIWDNGSYGPGTAYFLKITAGKKTLSFDYFTSSTSHTESWIVTSTSKANGISIAYEFEPGRIYAVFPEINNDERSITIGIKESSFPARFGWRMGPYLGWHRNTQGFPFVGPFILAQVGVAVPAGNSTVEFLAEANAGLLGYNPFEEDSPMFNVNAQAGGTANFYFGKSREKIGVGLGGGVGLEVDSNTEAVYIPYVRASFFHSEPWHFRLFADYSFAQKNDIWKRFGLGILFFTEG